MKNPDPELTNQRIFPKAWKQFLGLNILKFFDVDPDPGFGIFLTLDLGSGKEKVGSWINIPNPQH
jgi:hypothetical protein